MTLTPLTRCPRKNDAVRNDAVRMSEALPPASWQRLSAELSGRRQSSTPVRCPTWHSTGHGRGRADPGSWPALPVSTVPSEDAAWAPGLSWGRGRHRLAGFVRVRYSLGAVPGAVSKPTVQLNSNSLPRKKHESYFILTHHCPPALGFELAGSQSLLPKPAFRKPL